MAPEFLRLREYETLEGVALTDDAARALGSTPALQIRPSAKEKGRWDLSASQYVGVILAPDVEVRILPKIPVSRLFFLLAYARDADGWKDATAELEAAEDLVPSAAAAFVHHAERALARGVLQGYTVREEALPVIRGRIRTSDQASRRFGLLVPIEVTYDEFTTDVPENRLLKSAARRLLRLPGVPPTFHRRLRRLLVSLPEVTELVPGLPPPAVRFHRLNAHYRPAVRLAEIILQGSGVEFAGRTLDASAILFDMNRVFEDFLTAALSRELSRIGVTPQPQCTARLDAENAVPIRPDLIFRHDRRPAGVADMKYKWLETAPGDDVYQLLAYCTALGVRRGWLIHPNTAGAGSTHHIRNSPIRIDRVGIDLASPPETLLAAITALAATMRSATTQDSVPAARTPVRSPVDSIRGSQAGTEPPSRIRLSLTEDCKMRVAPDR